MTQEALTNVLKHANSPTEAEVVLAYDEPVVTLTVTGDDAPGVVAPSVTRRLLDAMAPRLPDLRSRTPHDADGKLARLTEREVEELTEVAGGLSNAEIAEQLHVTEATVKTHVGRILGKLELRDRVQAVVYAYEIRLVVPS